MNQPNIPNKAPVLYVIFTAEINPNTAEALTSVLVQAQKRQVGKLYLAFSSPGGSVQAGVELYNTLRAMPFELTTHNIGSVNSMGNAVFLAGSTRYADASATFMFHGVGFDVTSPIRIEEQFARDRLESILADQNRIGTIIGSQSTLNEEKVAELFRTQRTCNAEWAKDNGIVEDVRDFNVPNGVPVVSFVFDRQAG